MPERARQMRTCWPEMKLTQRNRVQKGMPRRRQMQKAVWLQEGAWDTRNKETKGSEEISKKKAPTKRRIQLISKNEKRSEQKKAAKQMKQASKKPIASMRTLTKILKKASIPPEPKYCNHKTIHKIKPGNVLRICKRQCNRFRGLRKSFGSAGVLKMCRQKIQGTYAGLHFALKFKIGRRRCNQLKVIPQHKRFLNRTYVPSASGHVDAFDEAFALPRLIELLEQSYNSIPIALPNPEVCQATLGLADYGGTDKFYQRQGKRYKRIWNGTDFTWQRSGFMQTTILKKPRSLRKPATCNLNGFSEEKSVTIDDEAVFGKKVLASKSGKHKQTIYGCSWPEGGAYKH